MVQILPANPKISFSQKLGNAVGETIQGLGEIYSQSQAQERMQQENESAKRMGIDLSGITDPKLRQSYVASALQGANQRELEMIRQQGKQRELEQRQDFISQLFGGKKAENEQAQDSENPVQSLSGYDPSRISDEEIAMATAIDPNMGRLLQAQKDVGLREKRAQRDFELRKERQSPEFKRQQQLEGSQAQADVKYNQQLQEASKQHALKEQTLERLEQLNKKGVTGKPYEKLLEKFGLVNLTSEGRREFAADVKNLITDIRSILGGQFSNFEFQTILNAYPSADFSKEANEAIIKNLKDFQDIKSKEVVFANEIKRENGGKIPPDFQSKVNERVHDYAMSKMQSIRENTRKIINQEYGISPGHTLMFDPQGNELNVPEDQITHYLELGASLP